MHDGFRPHTDEPGIGGSCHNSTVQQRPQIFSIWLRGAASSWLQRVRRPRRAFLFTVATVDLEMPLAHIPDLPESAGLAGLRSRKKLLTSLRPVARGAFEKLHVLATCSAEFRHRRRRHASTACIDVVRDDQG